MPSESGWDTPSGLLTEYEGTVIEAQFQASERTGRLNLELKMATDNPDVPEWTERYGCGQDWKSLDGGETAEGGAKFTANSGYGRFITHVKDCLGEVGDDSEQLNAKMQNLLGASPKVANIWVGLRFYMSEFDESFTNRTTNEKVVSMKNYPTRFLGKDGELTADGAAAPAQAPTDNPLAVLSDEQVAALNAAAKDRDFAGWCEVVLEVANSVDGLLPSDPRYVSLISAASDEAGLYAQMRA